MIETKFKRTKVGMIPEDWDIERLGSIATLINGRAYSQEELLLDGKYRVLRVGNFFTNDFWYYSNLELPKHQYCERNDLLYAWSCTYGAYLWNGDKTIFHYHIWKVLCKDIDKRFLFYLLNNDIEKQKKDSQGGTMSHITKEYMSNKFFVFPRSIKEQISIATALTDIDELITALDKKVAKKKLIKQGAMQQLLTGKKRLPGFSGEWVEKQLGDCFSIGHGKDYKQLGRGDIPVYGTGGVMTYVDESLYSGETVCIGRKGTIDKPIYYKGRIWTVDTLFYTYSFISVSPLYLYYKFLMIDWLDYNEASGVPSLSQVIIKSISIDIPLCIEEQTAIATLLSDMDKEISDLEARRDKYKLVKQGMMQKLLTGQIRLI